MGEDPNVKEPTEPTQTPESAASDIIAKLKELEIDTPDRLEGVYNASKEVGSMANELGATRQEVAALKEQIAKIGAQPPDLDYSDTPGVDIGSLIDQRLEAFATKQRTVQTEAQAAYLKTMASIQSDPDYKLVEEIFNTHMNAPNTQSAVWGGQTNPKDEYNKIVRTFYRESLKQSKTALEGLMPKPPKAPHIESGESHTVPMPTVDEEKKGKIKNLTNPDKGWSGTDQEIETLVKTVLPASDAFWKQE